MKVKIKYITVYGLRILLMVIWLYVALDKLGDLPSFYRSLLKQPFPNWWADVLFWLLPMIELGIALLFARKRYIIGPARRAKVLHKGIPFLLSALLMLVFTVYIGMGVAGLYAKRPCACASVFRGLSWERHLLVNVALVGLSILGWYLSDPTAPMHRGRARYKKLARVPTALALQMAVWVYFISHTLLRMRFPKRFAPFPGRPVDE